MKTTLQPPRMALCALIAALAAGSATAQVVTNDEPAGSPATPTPRQLPNPQIGIITNAEARRVRGDFVMPAVTNRPVPGAANSATKGNLTGGEWFYPNGTNAFYHRGTNAYYRRGTNGFYRESSGAIPGEFIPDGNNVYRMGPDGVYHHYDIRNAYFENNVPTNGLPEADGLQRR